jgi:endonuclease YncB( thermonuclease family)
LAGAALQHAQLMTFRFAIPILMVASVNALADDWISGSPRVVDSNTLSIAGETVTLHGIQPIDSRRLCNKGGRRFPCHTLAISELGRLVSNQTVLCERLGMTAGGHVIGRCVVDDLELAAELVSAGLAEIDDQAIIPERIDAADAELGALKNARGGPAEIIAPPPASSRPAPAAVVPEQTSHGRSEGSWPASSTAKPTM